MIIKILEEPVPETLKMVPPKYDVVVVGDHIAQGEFIGHVIPAETRVEYESAFEGNGTQIYARRLDLVETQIEKLKGASFRGGGRIGPDFLRDYVEGLNRRGWSAKDAQYALDDVCAYFCGD